MNKILLVLLLLVVLGMGIVLTQGPTTVTHGVQQNPTISARPTRAK